MGAASAQVLKNEQPDNPLAEIKPKRAPKRYTLGEYLRREERSRERHEYFDGIITPVPTAKGPHNIITVNIGSALKVALKATGKQYVVLGSSQKVYFPEMNMGLYPDVLVVCEKPEYWDDEALLLTNPLLIVEVLSKSTRHFDHNNKFSHYKTLPSFKEYVLIEQTQCQVETWFREAPDLWRTSTAKDPAGTLPLRSIGCELSIADIYEHVSFEAVQAETKKRKRKEK
jgi:Uma2 family endonuclease